ncbi:MAG: DoxX family protein [Planctomycetales bacterium]|nr:DoxX family protein [bacterium]UNM08878.1 MAG: DoxX family protein [Planctomycetales bacterium]
MQQLAGKWQSWTPMFLSIMRIIAAFVFIPSGASKLFNWPVPLPDGVTISFMSQAWVGGVLELLGGSLLLLGLCTRPVAFLLSGMMAVAYFQFHAPGGFWPSGNGGTPAVLFCFVWLYISAAGPGPLSIDALLARGRKQAG